MRSERQMKTTFWEKVNKALWCQTDWKQTCEGTSNNQSLDFEAKQHKIHSIFAQLLSIYLDWVFSLQGCLGLTQRTALIQKIPLNSAVFSTRENKNKPVCSTLSVPLTMAANTSKWGAGMIEAFSPALQKHKMMVRSATQCGIKTVAGSGRSPRNAPPSPAQRRMKTGQSLFEED